MAWRKVTEILSTILFDYIWLLICVYFYAIGIGPQGFCAVSVKSCLRSLGFNNKLQESLADPFLCIIKMFFWNLAVLKSKSSSLDHPVSMSNLELMLKKSNLNGVSISALSWRAPQKKLGTECIDQNLLLHLCSY